MIDIPWIGCVQSYRLFSYYTLLYATFIKKNVFLELSGYLAQVVLSGNSSRVDTSLN